MPLSDLKKMKITHVMDETGKFLEARKIQEDVASFKQVFVHDNIRVYSVSY